MNHGVDKILHSHYSVRKNEEKWRKDFDFAFTAKKAAIGGSESSVSESVHSTSTQFQ